VHDTHNADPSTKPDTSIPARDPEQLSRRVNREGGDRYGTNIKLEVVVEVEKAFLSLGWVKGGGGGELTDWGGEKDGGKIVCFVRSLYMKLLIIASILLTYYE
jgi:hypothetical protein